MLFFVETILHLDKYLLLIANHSPILTYLFLFLIIFLETGVVVTPFLPGDSLIFTAGTLAAVGSLKIGWLFLTFFIAAIFGDAINYHIGKIIGPKIFTAESSIFFNKQHLSRAQKFYEKHGKKTIIIARFIPIVRTFAPFVAGIGTMPYKVFLIYNIIGAAIWCGLFTLSGFWFGNIPWVKDNFGIIILAIIIISVLPLIKEIINYKKNKI